MTPRTALVTGANRGLGRAVAQQLHGSGYAVALGGRDAAALHRVADALGPGATPVLLDVTDPDSVRQARERIGPVDVLVNNAGVLTDAGLRPSTVPLDLVADHFTVNTIGSWRVTQAFLPDMVARGWGRVVLVSSGTSTFSNGVYPGTPAYSVSKAALNALTVMFAEETRGSGVLVNAVNPGRVRTRMMPDATVSPEDAAPDVAWVAELPSDGPTGKLFRSRRVVGW